MNVSKWFLAGIFLGLLGAKVPIIVGLVLVACMLAYIFGYWDKFWYKFQMPAQFRKLTKREELEVQTALAGIEGIAPERYAVVMKEAHLGVAEYRGEKGIIKAYAIAMHGHDEMMLFLKESATGKLELSGWSAPKAERK